MLQVVALMGVVLVATVDARPNQRVTPIHPGTGGSPHVRYAVTLDGVSASIEYGRPSLKGRAIETLRPDGRVWRTGADEATILRVSAPLSLGSHELSAGAYSLYTIPGQREWMLIVNADVGQWGTQYAPGRDVLRVPMRVTSLEIPIEQLTITIEGPSGARTLAIAWGQVRAEVPIGARSGRF